MGVALQEDHWGLLPKPFHLNHNLITRNQHDPDHLPRIYSQVRNFKSKWNQCPDFGIQSKFQAAFEYAENEIRFKNVF